MAGLSEYLVWRGDITFDEVSLNVVDALLLSQLSYLNLQGIIGKTERKKSVLWHRRRNVFGNYIRKKNSRIACLLRYVPQVDCYGIWQRRSGLGI